MEDVPSDLDVWTIGIIYFAAGVASQGWVVNAARRVGRVAGDGEFYNSGAWRQTL